MNIVKGKIFDIEDKDDIFNGVIHNPTDPRKFDKALDLVAKSGTKEEELFDFIRRVRKTLSKDRMSKFLYFICD